MDTPQICKLVYAIKNSSTLALPQWYHILEALSFEVWLIPRDIRTRWNVTYDMLDFTYQYKKAINKITNIQEMKLHAYKIKLHKWEIVKQLCDFLKVNNITFVPSDLMFFIRFSKMLLCSFHVAAHLTLHLSSLPWITSINIWHWQPPATSMTLPSGLPLQSGRKLWTGIMTGRTIWSYIGLQWVRLY